MDSVSVVISETKTYNCFIYDFLIIQSHKIRWPIVVVRAKSQDSIYAYIESQGLVDRHEIKIVDAGACNVFAPVLGVETNCVDVADASEVGATVLLLDEFSICFCIILFLGCGGILLTIAVVAEV